MIWLIWLTRLKLKASRREDLLAVEGNLFILELASNFSLLFWGRTCKMMMGERGTNLTVCRVLRIQNLI